jgi:uncharacterized protein
MNYRHVMAAVLFALVSLRGFSQQPASSPTPQKPYRERLLDRARNGDADAQFELGKNYETGRIGLPQDFSQAQYWYGKGAEQGDPFSEASLGILFNFGKGVPRDYVKALMWYERAVAHSKGGDQESIVEMRDALIEKMTHEQIAEAERLAKEWKAPAKATGK